MSRYNTQGGGSGRNAFSHSLISSGEDAQEVSPMKNKMHGRKKSLKLKKLQTRRILRTSRRGIRSTDSETNDEEEDADDEPNSDGGEDDKTRGFAPSDAKHRKRSEAIKAKLAKMVPSKRQAGRSAISSKTTKNGISSHTRQRSSEKVRFSTKNLSKVIQSPSSSHDEDVEAEGDKDDEEEDGIAIEDPDLDSNDDAAYDNLAFLSESEVDDEAVEEMETQYLIQHLTEAGELPGEGSFAEAYDLYHSARSGYPSEAEDLTFGDYILPSTEVGPTNQAPSAEFGSSLVTSPVDLVDAADLFSPLSSHFGLKSEPLETGLQTPSSLPQSMTMLDFDSEATEAEEMAHKSINSARLKRSSGRGLPVATPSARRNSKPKTPKVGSFKVDKKKAVMRHAEGKFVVEREGKVAGNGTITPGGILTSESKRRKPIPLVFPSTDAITAPSSALTSPAMEFAQQNWSQYTLSSNLVSSEFPDLGMADSQHLEDFRLQDFVIVKDDQQSDEAKSASSGKHIV